MDNKIIIKLLGEDHTGEVRKALDEQTKKSKELEDQMGDLAKEYVHNKITLKGYTDATNDNAEAVRKLDKEYREKAKALKEEQEATKKSITTIEQNSKASNLLEGSTKSAMAQIREMRNLMMEMEETGNMGDMYEQVAIKAAALQDQMGDLQQRIAILASDTANLDSAMSLGSGLAGGFNVATSAAELLGGETEGLQQAFYKVQGVLSVLNGVQEVANTLNKDSAFRVIAAAKAKQFFNSETRIEAALLAKSNTAAQVSAKGLKVLRLALASTGIGLLVVGIASLIAYFQEMNDNLTNSFEGWNQFKQVAMGALEVVRGTLSNIGESLVKLVTGDFKGAWEALKKVADVESKYQVGVEKEAAEQVKKVAQASYDTIIALNSRSQAMYAKNLQDGLRAIAKAEQQEMNAAKARHASSIEMARLELSYAMERAAVTQEQNEKAIEANEKEVAAAKRNMEAKQRALNAQRKGTQQYLDALNEYTQAQQDYYSAVGKTDDLRQQIDDANQAVVEASLSVRDVVIDMQQQTEQARIDVMKQGMEKEIEQIELNYREQLRQIQGDSEEEIALRKALENKKALEIAQVRKKNALLIQEAELEVMNQAVQKENNKASIMRNLDVYEEYYTAQAKYKMDSLDKQVLGEEQYKIEVLRIEGELNQQLAQLNRERTQQTLDGLTTALGYMQQLSGMAFDVLNSQVQAEMDALNETYTTDAAEAAKNANKKYITEKEYEKRKAELEMRAARYKKTQTMIDIALQTALAIITTIGQLGATPWGIAASVIAGTMGAAQLAIAAAKPLAQYAKGRKGGKGEYALVGEKGPELMYVPEGASIVPNNKLDKPDTWGQYGVPMLAIPDRPDVDTTGMVTRTESGWKIDYDRLGAAVAKNIPPQNAVTVSVDKSGIYVNNGRETRQYLNTKYNASWN